MYLLVHSPRACRVGLGKAEAKVAEVQEPGSSSADSQIREQETGLEAEEGSTHPHS